MGSTRRERSKYYDIGSKRCGHVLIDVQTQLNPIINTIRVSNLSLSTSWRGQRPGTLVCIESTVAPVPENLVMPILESASGLTCGKDFHWPSLTRE